MFEKSGAMFTLQENGGDLIFLNHKKCGLI